MWEQTRKGSTYLCERLYDPLTGSAKTLTVKIQGSTAKARREAENRLLAKIENRGSTQTKRLHLSDLIELYEAEHERSVRKSTFARDHSALQTMLKITGDVYIDKMTAGYIRMKLVESGKSNSTLNELIKRMKTFLMWSYQNDYISREVPDKLTLFHDQSAREKIADKFLEKDELQKLLGCFDLDRHRLLTEFLALSGLRIGEALALDNCDVDSEYIHVTKTYNENFSSIGDPKTASSVRDVYIQPELAEVIRKIRICMMKQKMMFGYEDRGYFFSGIDGGRLGYAAYNKQLHLAAEKSGIKKKIVPHTLRHTMTSLFAEAGVPLEVISRRLGHENSNITKRVYLHVTNERKHLDNQEIKSVSIL